MAKENSPELLQILEEMRGDRSKEKIEVLVPILEQCNLFVPAVLPANTDPKIVKRLAESNGKPVDIPKESAPKPLFLENNEKKRYLPLFTSKEQSEKAPQKAPIHISMPFKACLNIVANEESVVGVTINPYDHNVVMNTSVNKKPKKEIKLTEVQMHAVVRQTVEADLLPKKLFEEKDTMIDELRNDAGAAIVALYKKVYPEQVECPYETEEFDAMVLNIRDDLTIVRVAMPEQKLVQGTCPMVLISWNPQKEEVRYFGIVKGKNNEPDHILEALADGKKIDLGEAPADGSEFQFIIDLNTPS